MRKVKIVKTITTSLIVSEESYPGAANLTDEEFIEIVAEEEGESEPYEWLELEPEAEVTSTVITLVEDDDEDDD